MNSARIQRVRQNPSEIITILNYYGIQSVGELAIIDDNMEFYWNLCHIENGYKKRH